VPIAAALLLLPVLLFPVLLLLPEDAADDELEPGRLAELLEEGLIE